jgi:hypothetical protein
MSDEKELTIAQKIAVMRERGWEQVIPATGRTIRLRAVEPDAVLREGDCPDILTPILLKSIYSDVSDAELRTFLEKPLEQAQDALKYVEMLNLMAGKAVADDTPLDVLTLTEKKWIFRLCLGGAELLVRFRYQPQRDVETAPQGDPEPQVAE